MDVDIGNASGDAETIVNVSDSTTSNNDWSPDTPTDSNLLKLPFTVNNPGIRLTGIRKVFYYSNHIGKVCDVINAVNLIY